MRVIPKLCVLLQRKHNHYAQNYHDTTLADHRFMWQGAGFPQA